MNPDNVDEWVLVLEYLPRPADEAKGYGHLHAIMEELRTWHPAALFSPDRYALQLRVLADRPMEALRRGLDLHDRAVGTVGMPVPSLARIEVMTEGEFESQWNETGRGFAPATPAGTVLTNEIYWSTRALLRAATPADLAEVLASFVIAVGGRIQHGSPQIPAGDIAIDISLEDGEGCHAIVDRVSVPGLIIEHSLPTLVADARAARARLRQRDPLTGEPRTAT
ncbi:MAG: hypothetical protein M3083_00255 [Actinomycetota bacterium]|nr:hypothetical protein [Actinomycetota bacterium]